MKHLGKIKGTLTRECSKCGGDLGDRYGKQRYCKKCHAANMRATRPKHKDLPELARKKANARAYSKELLKRGKIERKPCEICGSVAQMHHDDYSKPAQVRWLCRPHHLEWHRLNELPYQFHNKESVNTVTV
jgi:hypothetical protein